MPSWRIKRMPGSGYGRLRPFQREMARPRTPVTPLKAGCLVSSSFFAADRYAPSAPNESAASAFCSADKDFRTPNHVKLNRTAAIVVRNRRAAVAAEAESEVEVGRSSNVLIQESPCNEVGEMFRVPGHEP